MGASSFFCCLDNQQPKCLASTGIACGILSFAFLIWGVVDLEYKYNAIKVIYIIAFAFVIVICLAFIALFILLSLPKTGSYSKIMNIGRLICLGILVLCGITFILELIAWIFLLIDYSKLHSYLKDLVSGEIEDEDGDYDWAENLSGIESELQIAGHEWGAVIVPSIITLLSLVVMGLVSYYLYKIFTENYNLATQIPVTTTSNANTVDVTVSNMNQPGLLPNNNEPVPPTGTNLNNNVENKQN